MTSNRLRLVAPDLNSRRSRLADWLELQALTSDRQSASISSIRSHVRRISDGRDSATSVDAEGDDGGEPEITDRLSDDLEEKLSEELSFRAACVGSSYPFELVTDEGGRSQLLKLRGTWNTLVSGELIYIFCLLDSGIRDGIIEYPSSARSLVNAIGSVFQVCACLAVGGYTSAEVVSFGFPRARGNGFLPALQQAWSRYGSYKILSQVPFGWDDKLKDGGVDIIAWRHFPDGFAATFIMFVQVASGLDWKDKEVSGDVRALRKWFDGSPFDHFLPAICIPFPLWFDLDEPPENRDGVKLAFLDGVRHRFAVREAKFGIIFDRGRIAQCAAHAFSISAASGQTLPIDGIDRVAEISTWVTDVMSRLGEERAGP